MEQATTNRYWCYSCQKYYPFSTNKEIYVCGYCDSDAIEIMDAQQNQEDSRPSQFSVYKVPEEQSPSPQVIGQLETGVIPRRLRDRTVLSIMSTSIHSLSDFPLGSNLRNLIEQLMNNESNLSAASEDQISKLKKISKVHECSICQQQDCSESKQQEETIKGYKLPCNHQFHIDCIHPWLKRTNTCPTCRKSIITKQ